MTTEETSNTTQASGANSNEANGDSKLRLTILLGLLGLALFALYYDYKVARPAVESAYVKVATLNADINQAADHRRMTSADVQSAIGRAPSETFTAGLYTIEAYRWSAGMPLEFHGLSGGEALGVGRKTHTYFAVYKKEGPDLAFMTHHKFRFDANELTIKPDVLEDIGDEEEIPDEEMGFGSDGGGYGPGGYESGSPGDFGGGPGGGGDRRGIDPEAMFAERDADSDGKLVGDELSDRMKENLEAIDTDGDGAVSLPELIERMRSRRGGRGGPGGGRSRGGEGGEGRPRRPDFDSNDEVSSESPESDEPVDGAPVLGSDTTDTDPSAPTTEATPEAEPSANSLEPASSQE